ncbi:Fasciclin domain-containing protein [Cephalotus follicularis]|uniref:Fasciclin domain-containing protein n=1 Tax=Cephalotus follicularis TaxID=3775 RepID=A0A1Q3BEF2_CEPFO|nr:Fasciclin domain-containing protein [Cephalotus follicularis]
MQQTSVDTQLYNQLNNSNNGITIFAPSDNAFSSLKPGTLNSLTDQQKVELIQFHVIPQHLSMSTFQTASNPLRTNAGDSADWLFPLNVTTSGNSVNITTGLTNTSVSGTVYTDDQLAIYQVDQVLQPPAIFNPSPPPPAPAPAPSKKKGHGAATDTSVPADASSPMHINIVVSVGVAIVAAFCL